jgi:prepilin-type N-terminal cleavage/methylation domain-containing protein
MVTRIKKRLSSEGGFTLIELLVVMIIIAILMAVAIPVFLGQKQKALATNAKQNAKHVQDTLESCAAGTSSGTLQEGMFNCGTVANLTDDEPSLSKLLVGMNCGGRICVVVNVTGPDDYTINSTTNSTGAQGAVDFRLTRNQNGVTRDCVGVAGAGMAKALKRMCPTNAW